MQVLESKLAANSYLHIFHKYMWTETDKLKCLSRTSTQCCINPLLTIYNIKRIFDIHGSKVILLARKKKNFLLRGPEKFFLQDVPVQEFKEHCL